MSNPGAAPLVVITAVGYGSFVVSSMRRRAFWAQSSVYVALSLMLVAAQAAIRRLDSLVVCAGAGIIFGCAVIVTKGHAEGFFDKRSTEAADRAYRIQVKTLILAAVPEIVLIASYRDLFR